MRDRVEWIDSLKGIGIILVIIGHCTGHTELLFSYIYSFHMPLFFFAAGFLLDRQRYNGPWHFIRTKAPARIVPYVLFALLSYALFLYTTAQKTGLSVSSVLSVDGFRPYVIQPIIGLVRADRIWLGRINNVTLWFLPCLLIAESSYFLLQRAMAGRGSPAIAGTILAGISFTAYLLSEGLSVRLPWALETALVSVVFYGAGSQARALSAKVEAALFRRPMKQSGMFVLLLILSLWSSFIVRPAAGNAMLAYIRYVLAALSGIGVASFLARWAAGARPLQYFGKNSLLLLGLHLALMTWSLKLINGAADLMTQEEIVVSDNVLALMVVVITLIVSIPIVAMTNWFIPRFKRAIASDGGMMRYTRREDS